MLGRLRKAREALEDAEESFTAAPPRGVPSVARDLVVAALDPEEGKLMPFGRAAVPGALLLELVREGRLEVSGDGRKTRVTVRDLTPLGDAELDDALLAVETGVFGNKVSRLVEFLPTSDEVLDRLVAADEVTEESQQKLGMFSVTRRYPAPSARRDEVVGRLRSALLGESVPDERTAMLVVVLLSSTNLKHWVGRQHVKAADCRAREILEGLPEHEQRLVAAIKAAVVSGNADSTTL